MSDINFTYSLWWIFPIILVSLGLSLLLYYKNKKEEFSNKILFFLASLRFFIFVILAVLLLSPVIRSWKSRIEKPIIIVAVDNSRSMILNSDSNKVIANYKKMINGISDELGDKFKIDYFSFGEELRKNNIYSFTDNKTDISSVFNIIQKRYEYANVGAMLLVSDGIYNVGENPIYGSKGLPFPIYTIGVGDSTVHKDYAIQSVRYNKTVFIHNEFPIEVSINAKQLKNSNTKLLLYSNGKLIKSKGINIKSDYYIQKYIFNIKANEAGMHSYKIVLQSFDGEQNTLNNIKTIYLDILGEKKKVLLFYSHPHPDIAAIKQILKKSDEYILELKQLGKSSVNVNDYSLIIYHQIPNSLSTSVSVFEQAKAKNIPFIMIFGAETSVRNFNLLNNGVSIKSNNNSFMEMHAILNKNFSEFIIPKNIIESIGTYPPLIGAFGTYRMSSSFRSVFYQRIGNVNTEYPLIAVSNISGKRDAYIFGEGLWRWRLHDFMENRNHDLIDNFFLNIVRYTSLSKEHSRLNIQWDKSFSEQENVEFNAEFYNATYELVQNADIKMEIVNSKNERFIYAFGKKNLSYYLSAGRFPPGIYSFKVSVEYSGQTFSFKGKFNVTKVELEAMNLKANYNLLRKISFESSAKFFLPSQSNKFVDDIRKRDDIVNIESQQVQYKDLIRFPILIILLLLLLTIEWFVRKQRGSY